jgi:hypothetical protein
LLLLFFRYSSNYLFSCCYGSSDLSDENHHSKRSPKERTPTETFLCALK